MSKLAFPSVAAPYRGFVSELRTWFQRIASFLERSPGAASDLKAHTAVLATAVGLPVADVATKAVVSNTQQLVIPITGTYATKITLTVAGGVVTSGVLS